MRIFKVLLLLMVVATVSGCASNAKVVTKDVLVYKYKNVYVPTPCKVEVNCDFTGSGYEPTSKLLECVIDQKRALDYCRQNKGVVKDDHN